MLFEVFFQEQLEEQLPVFSASKHLDIHKYP
jgi:hypothetical protein